jgi:hypothetical protein
MGQNSKILRARPAQIKEPLGDTFIRDIKSMGCELESQPGENFNYWTNIVPCTAELPMTFHSGRVTHAPQVLDDNNTVFL